MRYLLGVMMALCGVFLLRWARQIGRDGMTDPAGLSTARSHGTALTIETASRIAGATCVIGAALLWFA